MIKYVENFYDYEVLDCGNNEKIERFNTYILKRPDPQAIWKMENKHKYKLNAIYHRSNRGGGNWEFFDLPEVWQVKYDLSNEDKMVFNLKPFSFKHTGIFPEQAVNWNYIYKSIKSIINSKKSQFNVLNLFAYTGGASIASALAKAKVVHVDASKGMVNWAKENAISSGLPHDSIRWIVDDCKKFIEREIRRDNVYDAIIMDPPSYGRGPNGEVWKLEDSIYDFCDLSIKLLSKENSFFILNSYTTGLQAGTMNYIVSDVMKKNDIKGESIFYELGLRVRDSNLILPEGATVIFQNF